MPDIHEVRHRVYRQSQLLQLQSVGSGGDGGSQQTLTAPHNTTHFLLQILQTLCLLCSLQQSSAGQVPHTCWHIKEWEECCCRCSCVVDRWFVIRVVGWDFVCRFWSQVSHLTCSHCDEHSFRGDCWLYFQRILNKWHKWSRKEAKQMLISQQ